MKQAQLAACQPTPLTTNATMALATFVKLSNVTNLSDARYAAGMGVNIVGFPIHLEEETQFGPQQFQDIVGWLAGVKTCGEFFGGSAEQIASIYANLKLDLAEVHDPVMALELAALKIPYIFNLDRVGAVSDRAVMEAVKQAELVIVSEQVAALSADRQKNKELVRVLDPGQLDALDLSEVAGIAIDGGEEERPGTKDMTPLQNILERLETE